MSPRVAEAAAAAAGAQTDRAAKLAFSGAVLNHASNLTLMFGNTFSSRNLEWMRAPTPGFSELLRDPPPISIPLDCYHQGLLCPSLLIGSSSSACSTSAAGTDPSGWQRAAVITQEAAAQLVGAAAALGLRQSQLDAAVDSGQGDPCAIRFILQRMKVQPPVQPFGPYSPCDPGT